MAEIINEEVSNSIKLKRLTKVGGLEVPYNCYLTRKRDGNTFRPVVLEVNEGFSVKTIEGDIVKASGKVQHCPGFKANEGFVFSAYFKEMLHKVIKKDVPFADDRSIICHKDIVGRECAAIACSNWEPPDPLVTDKNTLVNR